MTNPFHQTAAQLCQLGIKVFPVRWQSKTPVLTGNWKHYATSDFDRFQHLTASQKQFNLAVKLGPDSGILDLELDSVEAQHEFQILEDLFGSTQTVCYGSRRGLHRWFRWSEGLSALGNAVPKYRGIELRLGTGDKGAYSVVPPSLHESGQVWYQWVPGCAPWEIPIAPLPLWLENLFLEARKTSGRSVVEVARAGDDFIPEPGQRHAFALRLSWLLHDRLMLPKDMCVDMMKVYNEHVGKEGEVADLEIENMVQSIKRTPRPQNDFAEVDFDQMYQAASNIREEMEKLDPDYNDPMPKVFPQWLEEMGDIAQQSQIPRNFLLSCALTGAGAAIGSSVNVRFADGAPVTGTQIYTMGVAESGTGKSKAMKVMLKPFTHLPAFCTNTTTEALTTMLSKYPRGVLLQVSEGKQFTKMMGRYNTSGADDSSNNSLLCEAWSGDTIAIARQDVKKCVRVDNPHLTVAATIQGHNLKSFGVDDIMEGLMQRMLVYGADPVPPEMDMTASKELSRRWPQYHETILRLQGLRPNIGNELIAASCVTAAQYALNVAPILATLSFEAGELFKKYATWKRSPDIIGQWPEYHPFRADLVRHAEYALRIAVTLFFLHTGGDPACWEAWQFHLRTDIEIPLQFMQYAIDLMEWYWRQKQKLMGDLVEEQFARAMPQTVVTGQSLAENIQRFVESRQRTLLSRLKGSPTWTARDFYRALRLPSDQAILEIDHLITAGYVKQVGTTNRSPLYSFTEKATSRSEQV